MQLPTENKARKHNKNYMSIVVSVLTKSCEPATALEQLDRKTARNRQLHIVLIVNCYLKQHPRNQLNNLL